MPIHFFGIDGPKFLFNNVSVKLPDFYWSHISFHFPPIFFGGQFLYLSTSILNWRIGGIQLFPAPSHIFLSLSPSFSLSLSLWEQKVVDFSCPKVAATTNEAFQWSWLLNFGRWFLIEKSQAIALRWWQGFIYTLTIMCPWHVASFAFESFSSLSRLCPSH